MELVTADRWRAVCEAVGIADAEGEYRRLTLSWRSWGRRYHTLHHLGACLREFDHARDLAQHVAEVELALWFHDAIYRTYRSDNEARSAEWAARFLIDHGAPPEVSSRTRQLVLATAHIAEVREGDQALVVDIDLSILGQPRPIYVQFERDIRREYWWVPRSRYVTARRAILQSFIARSAIYHWPQFRERYEDRARENLQRAIADLGRN